MPPLGWTVEDAPGAAQAGAFWPREPPAAEITYLGYFLVSTGAQEMPGSLGAIRPAPGTMQNRNARVFYFGGPQLVSWSRQNFTADQGPKT
eukprot:3959720-Pyramimonas_sp.AAC.1